MKQEIINKSKQLIAEADAVVIGAGAGLSTAAGLEYGGARFRKYFSDYIEKYGLTDMYSSAFYNFPSAEEKWAYFSRHISVNRYEAPVFELYKELKTLVQDKNYFVITTNGDAQFERAGFDQASLFATQGDYRLFQCEVGCHDTLYDNQKMVEQMIAETKDFKIPSNLVPPCPVCDRHLVPHLRMDSYFIENENWRKASRAYTSFIQNNKTKKLLLLELGIGFNTPGIIRFPFEQMSINYKDTTLVRVNKGNVQKYYNISSDNLLIDGDIEEFILKLKQ